MPMIDLSPARKSPIIKADPLQIEKALLNLATNARDAMPHGGQLSISVTQVMIGEGSEILYETLCCWQPDHSHMVISKCPV
jgi:C4-dicarboxylate-specific signal transduction histidine kinase